ncbi:hypothetical protein IT157_01920 [bacterium]|nr:hypothetical protein [bacterium]
MNRFAIIGLIACATTAIAEIPLQLVAEIQLPARTITWDVQHYEDSTSFGWAAVTAGAAVWGEDSLGNDTLINPAVDTIWFKTSGDGDLGFLRFPRTEYDSDPWAMSWADLSLLKMQDVAGPVAAGKPYSIDWPAEDLDVYYFDLEGDSVFARQSLIHWGWGEEVQAFSMESWPAPPLTSQYLLVSGTTWYWDDPTGCDWDIWVAQGVMIWLPGGAVDAFQNFQLDIFDRSEDLSIAFKSGYWRYFYGCYDDEENHYVYSLRIGVTEEANFFNQSYFDTLTVLGRIVAIQDIDGTRRIFHTPGVCYDAVTGEIAFTTPSVNANTFSALIQNGTGQDLLTFWSGKFQIRDGRTGVWVDSTSSVLGVPKYTLTSPGFDQIVTFEDATKLVRVYEPVQAAQTLTIQWIAANTLELRWTAYRHATAYRLERANNPDFTNSVSDYFDSSVLSTQIAPMNDKEFFRVSPVFE